MSTGSHSFHKSQQGQEVQVSYLGVHDLKRCPLSFFNQWNVTENIFAAEM